MSAQKDWSSFTIFPPLIRRRSLWERKGESIILTTFKHVKYFILRGSRHFNRWRRTFRVACINSLLWAQVYDPAQWDAALSSFDGQHFEKWHIKRVDWHTLQNKFQTCWVYTAAPAAFWQETHVRSTMSCNSSCFSSSVNTHTNTLLIWSQYSRGAQWWKLIYYVQRPQPSKQAASFQFYFQPFAKSHLFLFPALFTVISHNKRIKAQK